MFASLNEKIGGIFDGLRRRGALSEKDIDQAMREVRIALLEADVALPVVKDFIKSLKEKALGAEVIRNVNPAQMVIKLVQDHLEALLGSEHVELNLRATPPAVVMMVGLQGSGKTTSSGKLALRLREKENKKVLLASLDVQRPAAQEQLEVLAGQVQVGSLPIVKGEDPLTITRRALKMGREEGYDVVILDTAGRLHIDEALMGELQQVRDEAKPIETLLVADSLTGQDAVNIAREFHEKITVSGIILTRVDGDGRGGAALSMRQITGQPIKFIGVGEKLHEFEAFHPKRIASRILDMGDVVSLVEKAAENLDMAEAEAMAKKLHSGSGFDFNDMLKQFGMMSKMGGIGSLMNFIPGMGKLKSQLEGANLDDKLMKHQEAIILSMTAKERAYPKLMNGSRKKRIAQGCGLTVPEVNKLIKAHKQMEGMMKKMKKAGGKRGMAKMMQQMGMGGAMPPGLPAGGLPKGGLPEGLDPKNLPPELRDMLKKKT
jgi:signal recognition particle subunit SRP54